jgi:hypothetical protein
MNPERWKQIDDLLQATLDLSEEERNAFLRQACSGDPSLEQEVQSLITLEKGLEAFSRRLPSKGWAMQWTMQQRLRPLSTWA